MRKLCLRFNNLIRIIKGSGKISSRFRSINLLLLALVSVSISIVMLFLLQNITDTVSKEYAGLYSSNTAKTLDAYFGSQVTLIKKAANSNAVVEWFADENNPEKKLAAYNEMMEIIKSLSSKNLYMGIEKSLHEFTVEENYTIDHIKAYVTLDPEYFDDAWYFECISSDKEYVLNVDIDKILKRKRVWLNYKVTRNGEVLGVLCTWLEFADLVEELFSEYDCTNVRGLVIDEKGVIHMDSTLLGDEGFLRYTVGDKYLITDAFSNSTFISSVNEYLEDIDGYFNTKSNTTVISMSKNKYRYATISPIAHTTWSVITFYNASSLFSIASLFPLLTIFIAILIIFIVVTSFASSKLIFDPLEKLTDSVVRIKGNKNECVYGIERLDEIGSIANTVQNMKDSLIDALDKVHYDALTGIYNRRYLEENLSRIIQTLSRTGGTLSVLMIDVDFFKEYNDTYGHTMGDNCLKLIAREINRSIARTDDFAARYGGEEFAVILPNTDERGAHIITNRIIENLDACRLPHEKSNVAEHVTISIGVTIGDVEYGQSAEEYLNRADEALYISKQSGRNKYTFLQIYDDSVKH